LIVGFGGHVGQGRRANDRIKHPVERSSQRIKLVAIVFGQHAFAVHFQPQGVDKRAVSFQRKVQMSPGAAARGANVANQLSGIDFFA